MKPINRLSLAILGIQFRLMGSTSLMRWIEAYSAGDAHAVSDKGIEEAQIEKVKFIRKYIYLSPAISFPSLAMYYLAEFNPMNLAAVGMTLLVGLGLIAFFNLYFQGALFEVLEHDPADEQKVSLSSRYLWRFADPVLILGFLIFVYAFLIL